jgi:uncharacterized protein (TIGR03089 family)
LYHPRKDFLIFMPTESPATVPSLWSATLARDPSRPVLTYYDDTTAERVELSATTLDNWIAKTANLIRDDAGLGPRTRAAVLLPPHWQSAAIMLGCWAAGLALAHGRRGAAPARADLVFAAVERAGEALSLGAEEVYLLSLAPLGARLHEIPPGARDYAAEVPGHGDRFTPVTPVSPEDPALSGNLGTASTTPGTESTTPGSAPASHGSGPVDLGVGATEDSLNHAALIDSACHRATELGLTDQDRLLIVDDPDHRPRPLDWLLVPLAAGASVVLSRDPDPGKLTPRMTQERVTAYLGPDGTALPEGVRRLT